MQTPTTIGPIIAWRLWFVPDATSLLHSLQQPQSIWQPYQNHQCACNQQMRRWFKKVPLHDPDILPEACICGIYALPDATSIYNYYVEEWQYYIHMKHKERCRHQLVARYGTSRPRAVIGKVALWGDVIEMGSFILKHVQGYRSQKAYPQKIFVSKDEWNDDADELAIHLALTYRAETCVINQMSDVVWQEGGSDRMLEPR